MTVQPDLDAQDEGPPEPEGRGQSLTRNFSVLMASQVVTWVLSLVGAVVIPRYLGAELLGRLHIANSLWAIGFIVSSFGMNLLLTKAIARDITQIGPMLGTSIAARVLLFVPVTIGLFVYALIADYSHQTLVLLGIVGAGSLIVSVTASITSILQGVERMTPMAIANIANRVVFVGGAIALLAAGQSVYAVAFAIVAGNAVSLVMLHRALRKFRIEIDDHSRTAISFVKIREMLRASAPYFGVGFFITLYLQIDAVVISLVVESEEVLGWYSIYDRLGGTLLFVPIVFITAIYPVLARLYADSADGHGRLTQKSFELMMLISVPIGFGLSVIARPLVELLFGQEFSEAGPVVAVGGVVTCLTYLTTVLGMFLISMDKQREWTRFIAIGALLTIPLDLFLVPFFQAHADNGAIGGAVAYLITEAVVLGGAIYLLPRGALGPHGLRFATKVVAAGLVMAAAVYPLRELPLPIPVCVGGITYVIMVLVLRVVTADDRELLLSQIPRIRSGRSRHE